MSEFKPLDDELKTHEDFEDKRFLLLFGALKFKPTGEKVEDFFAYFEDDAESLKQAALGDSAEALLTLTPARRSGQRLDFAFTESGSVAALQVVEYQDYRPVPIMATRVVNGASAKAFVDVLKKLEEQQHELNDEEEDDE